MKNFGDLDPISTIYSLLPGEIPTSWRDRKKAVLFTRADKLFLKHLNISLIPRDRGFG